MTKKFDPLIYNAPADMVQNLDLEFTEEWCANYIAMAYNNRQPIVDLEKLRKYRNLDHGITDPKDVNNFWDKKGDDNPQGGKAEYFNSDRKPCPLYQSLNQITRGYIQGDSVDIQVNAIDQISVNKKIKARQKEQLKTYIIDYMNFIGGIMGQQPLPYNTNIEKHVNGDQEGANVGDSLAMIDQIKSELADDPSYALLSEVGALKDGFETCHENMIKFMISDGNYMDRISSENVGDIMKVNAFANRCYTSAKDGTFKYMYCDIGELNVSPFKEKDGSDIDYIFQEETISWSKFMELVGGRLSKEKLQEIYEANRFGFSQFNGYLQWSETPQFYNVLNNTNIRIGYFELKKQVHDTNNGKYYEVIKKFYYLPIFSSGYLLKSPKYVFDIGNLQDMHRFGGMLEMANFSWIIFRDNSYQSWYETQEGILVMMNNLWNQYQNTASGIMPRGVVFAEETLTEIANEMLKAQEEELKLNGGEIANMGIAYQKIMDDIIKRFVQSGRGIFKRKSGQLDEKSLDPPLIPIQHQIYDDLQLLIGQIMSLYNMMIMSLGTNAQMLGQAPKPRQTVRGIELASESGLTMLKDMTAQYQFGLKELAKRIIYYDEVVIKEFNKKTFDPKSQRAEQMKGILGELGINWLEIFSDDSIKKYGILIQSRPTAEEKVMIFDYAMGLEQLGKLPIGSALTTKYIDNPKLAYLWLMATAKREQRIAVENQMAMMKQQGEQQQMQQQQSIQIQQQMMQLQAQVENMGKQLDAKYKTEGQLAVKDKTNQNRLEENRQNAYLEMEKARQEKEMNSL